MMTFAQFQETRKWHDDIPADIAGEGGPGFTYAGDLYIFAVGGGAAPALYRLVIMNKETLSYDLTQLERWLYDFGRAERVITD